MPTRQTDMPGTIARSDAHAQRLWKKARTSAEKTYGEGGTAARVAYAALKHEYGKRGDRWVRKAKKGPSDPQAARSSTTRPKSTDEPRAPTAGGKVAHSAADARKKAKTAQREGARARRKRRR